MIGDTIDPGMPDWVICGLHRPDGGVRVIASQQMTEAELRMEMDMPVVLDYEDLLLSRPRARYYLTAEMLKFTIVDAADYPTAMAQLMASWQPLAGERIQLPPAPRALGSG